MTSKLVSQENNKAVYTTEVSWEVFAKATDEVYRRNRGRFQVAGFRKGHVPRKIVEMNYGESVFYEDALNDVLPDAIEKAVKELELEPIGQPDVDVKELEKGKDIVFEITTETKPHPQLGDYTTIEVEKQEASVSEEEIDRVINQERDKNGVMRTIDDRAVQTDDEVTLDYSGRVDGELFEGGTAENQKLVIGSGNFIPGFEDQLIGHETGEEFDINVTFPAEYGAEDLAGKDAVFHIVLKGIQKKELPALDDEFAQDVSEFDTMEEYRNSIREKLMEQSAKSVRSQAEGEAIQKLIDISNVEVPDVMVEEQVENEIRDMAQQIRQMGISFDQYLKIMGGDMETIREQYRPQAKMRVSGDLVLSSLIEEQNITVNAEEIDQELERLAEIYGAEDKADFAKRVKDLGNEYFVAEDLKKRKAIDYLMTKVQFVEPKPVEEEKDEQSDKEGEE